MRRVIQLFLSVVASVSFSAQKDQAMKDAIRNGAIAKICYRVVDDEGEPVSNAVAHVWFSSYSRHQDDANWKVLTDANGMFTVEHRTNESLDCGFDKDGYYHSSDQILFRERKDVSPKVVDGKWQPYGETRTVVLKKIRNPQPLVDSGGKKCVRYPEDGVWNGFDLEKFDWCKPMGCGVVSDMMIRFTRKEMLDGFIKTMDVSFTNNQYSGAYEMATDGFSEMSTVYHADRNATFNNSLSYRFVRDKKGSHCYDLSRDKYLVFRVRPVLDENGNLVSAHYGRISGSWLFYERIGMKIGPVLFNPTPNDTNLEDAETYRLSLLRKKQNQEFERRRKAKGK